MNRILSGVVVAAFACMSVVATADDKPHHHKPPQAAFDACAKAKDADPCTYKGKKGQDVKGTCGKPRDPDAKGLVCHRIKDHDGKGSGAGSSAPAKP